jgi:hypothetical protein
MCLCVCVRACVRGRVFVCVCVEIYHYIYTCTTCIFDMFYIHIYIYICMQYYIGMQKATSISSLDHDIDICIHIYNYLSPKHFATPNIFCFNIWRVVSKCTLPSIACPTLDSAQQHASKHTYVCINVSIFLRA